MNATAAQAPAAGRANIEVVKISDYIGAEIRNVDLQNQTPELHEALKVALAENGVIFMRNQTITPEQHAQLAYGFGDPFDRTDPKTATHGMSFMGTVSKTEDQHDNIGNAWHIDQTYQQKPPNATILVARELPERGGDTLFADQHLAWETLSPELQQRILPLKAEHSYLAKYEELRAKNPWRPKLSQAQVDQVAPAVQPVVRTHPETGRKALFVSEHFTTRIVGLPQAEGDALLAELLRHELLAGILGEPL